MTDIVRGPVTKVKDGDTFVIKVTHLGTNNEYEYNNEETIRIADVDEPELSTAAGRRSKQDLEKKLNDKEVRCYIESRDTYGRLISKVKIL